MAKIASTTLRSMSPVHTRLSLVATFIFILNLQFVQVWCLEHKNMTLTSGPLFVGDTLVSKNFEAGIFPIGDCGKKHYLAIRYRAPIDGFVPWVANRDGPSLSSRAYWMLSTSPATFGNLEVYDESIAQPNKPLWTAPAGKNAVIALLEENGNLLLLDNKNVSIWESFIHTPATDTLLPGQRFYNTSKPKLASWKAADDPGSGSYTFGWNVNGTVQLAFQAPINSSNFSGGPFLPELALDIGKRPASNFGEVTYFELTPAEGLISISPGSSNSRRAAVLAYERPDSQSNPDLIRLSMDRDGGLRIWTWEKSDGWTPQADLIVSKRKDSCGSHCCTLGTCGIYGVCHHIDNGQGLIYKCECPKGFMKNDPEDSTKGCSPIVPLHPPLCTSENKSEVTFHTLERTDFPWGGDMTPTFLATEDPEKCKEFCRAICSCVAAVHSIGETHDDGISKGKCWIKSGPLWNGGWRTNVMTASDRTTYLKISTKQPLPAPGPNKGMIIGLSVAGSILGLGFLVCLITLHIQTCRRYVPKFCCKQYDSDVEPGQFTGSESSS